MMIMVLVQSEGTELFPHADSTPAPPLPPHACLHLASSTSSDKGPAPLGFRCGKGLALNVICSIQAWAAVATVPKLETG